LALDLAFLVGPSIEADTELWIYRKKGAESTSFTHLTHQTIITRLLPDTWQLADLVQCDTISAEQPAVYNKIALPALRRENSWFL
jgi:hypothetical protein